MAQLHAFKYDEALQASTRAVELAPNSASAHWSLAAACARTNRPDEVVDHAQKALDLSPRDPVRFRYLAVLAEGYWMLGELEEAAECAASSIEARPRANNPAVYNLLAMALVELGRIGDASSVYEAGRRAYPQFVATLEHNERWPRELRDRLLAALRRAGWQGTAPWEARAARPAAGR